MKTCPRCKITKPFEEYHKNKKTKDGYKYTCKKCLNEEYLASPIAKEFARERWLKFKYNIDSKQYDLLYENQKGCCAICEKPTPKGVLNVDHCHTTSEVRGLLCKTCNRAIGMIGENVGILSNAIKYLQESVASIQHKKD